MEHDTRQINKKDKRFQIKTQKFTFIPKSQRANYISQIMKVEQLEEQPPYKYIDQFTGQSSFKYKEYHMQYYYYENTMHPQAIAIFIHGLNMHGKSFSYMAKQICYKNTKLNSYAFDQLNFGKSDGPFRGRIQSLQDSCKQVQIFVKFLMDNFQKQPKVFLVGHSYGGSVAFKMCLKYPEIYSGVVLLAPALRLHSFNNFMIKYFIKLVGSLISKIGWLSYPQNGATKYNLQQKFKKDPLIYHGGVVPKTIQAIYQAMIQVSQQFKQFNHPFLGIGAGIQKATDPFALIDLQKQCQSQDKTIIYYENMWHLINEQQEYGDITQIVGDWLKERI